MKDVVDNVADSWSEMQAETMSRAWNKLWPPTETYEITIEGNDIDGLTTEISALTSSAFNTENDEMIEWLNCDNDDVGYQLLTEDEIIEEFIGDETVDESDADYDGGDSESLASVDSASDNRKEAKEAIDSIQKFIEWYQQQEEADMIHTMVLRKLRALAVKKSETSLLQTKLSDFFESQ